MRLLLIFFLFPILLSAQTADSTAVESMSLSDAELVLDTTGLLEASLLIDSNEVQKVKLGKKVGSYFKNFFKDYPNPNKALLTGLVIPGGGQIYNESFWKVPLVYGAYGTVITLIQKNTQEFEFYQDQFYKFSQNRFNPDLEVPFELDASITERYNSPAQVKVVRDEFRELREYSWIALFGVTLLSVADAFVDCHLKDFDVSDDLSSVQLKPATFSTPGWGTAAGVGVTITLK